MSLATAELPTDPNELRAFALACQGELKVAELSVQVKALEIETLRMQIAKLRRMQFGRSSERIMRQTEQLELRLEEMEAGEAEEAAKADAAAPVPPVRRKGKPKRKPLPGHQPRQEVTHQPAGDGACTCPDCGKGMARLGEDVTEVLDYVPGRFQVIRNVRPKYACTACDAITQASAPAMPVPRGRATRAMLAHLLVSKFVDHLPLYRQSEIYAREGVELDRSTLADWVGQAAWLLDPVVAAIRKHVFSAEKIHGDDTTVPVLAPGLGRTATGRLWVYVRDDRLSAGRAAPAAAYFYSPDRGAEHPAAHMASFTGYLQADGYAGSMRCTPRREPSPARSSRSLAGLNAGACSMMHGMQRSPRSPRERWTGSPRPSRSKVRPRFAPAAERVEHKREIAPLLDAFFDWSAKAVTRLSGKLPLAEAFRYKIKRRDALTRFVTDGRLEADNNVAQNTMRAISLGRKHFLFVGSNAGGERAAAIYTLAQTAKLNGLNPETYLSDILAKIAEGHTINRVGELEPWKMLPPAEPTRQPNPEIIRSLLPEL